MPRKVRADDRRGGRRSNTGTLPHLTVLQEGDRVQLVLPDNTVVTAIVKHALGKGLILGTDTGDAITIALLSEPEAWCVYRRHVKGTGTVT